MSEIAKDVATVRETAHDAPAAVARKKLTLLEAVEALMISESWLEEAGGELTPEVEALLNEADGDLKEKVERVALKVKQLEGQAKAIKEEADRLTARARARSNGADSLKRYLERCMNAVGLKKVDGLLCTVAMQLNPPKVEMTDGTDLKELYEAGFPGVDLVPVSFALNKKAVLEAVKEAGDPARVLPKDGSIRVVRTESLKIR